MSDQSSAGLCARCGEWNEKWDALRERAEKAEGALAEALEEAAKWKRIRTPTHGPCCTCQACGLDHDECRCDLDELADELAEAREAILSASSHQPMYNGRPSCPFCNNFVDDEETHHPRCIVVSVRAALEEK